MSLTTRHLCVASLDVVGYSRMVSHNAAEAAALIRQLREKLLGRLKETGGQLFGGSGDGYLIEFEQHREAVAFCLALQYGLKHQNEDPGTDSQLYLRIGIDSGEVVDDSGVLHGECINIAVRLQEAAPSGGVLASQRVQERLATASDFLFAPLGNLHLKNISGPLAVFSLQRPNEALALSSTEHHRADILESITAIKQGSPIAILPFANKHDDPKLEHICSGFREELALLISRSKMVPVVEGSPPCGSINDSQDALEFARKLDTRYVLTGALGARKDGFSVRIKLLETSSGNLIWGDKFRAEQNSVFQTLDDLVLQIAGSIGAKIARHEEALARARRISRSGVTDLIWRGRWHMNRLTKVDSLEAGNLFRKALELDPENAEATIQLCYLSWIGNWAGRKSGEDIEAFQQIAYKALNFSDGDPRAHFLVGSSWIFMRNTKRAEADFAEAVRINPSFAHAYAQLGSCKMLSGEPTEAIPLLELSLRLNPSDFYVFYVLGELAACHCMLGNWDESTKYAWKSMSYRPFYWHARMSEINASARSGNMVDAKRSYHALLARRPNFSRQYVDWLPFVDPKWADYFYGGIELARQWKN